LLIPLDLHFQTVVNYKEEQEKRRKKVEKKMKKRKESEEEMEEKGRETLYYSRWDSSSLWYLWPAQFSVFQ
jgi:hypothetical protein